jgi:pyridinium-3,5-bisthiocarboxylic acid mononucleotide nickel chelatase
MSKIAYWDCPAGIAGDMCLGALVSAGVPLEYFTKILQQLGLDREVQLRSELVSRCGQEATKVHVEMLHHHGENSEHHTEHHAEKHSHRRLPEIEQMIGAAKLPTQVEVWSLAVFRQLAIAEGKVHGIPPEQVHFHEVGAIDAITDIVCTCAGLEWLGVERIFCSALPTGGGFVNCEHGRLPVPVPATLKLWEMHQVPVFSNGIDKELVTPTGAALAVTLSEKFGAAPKMKLKQVGLGAGDRDLSIPNIVRLWLGKPLSPDEVVAIAEIEEIAVLETQVDDLSPQAISYTMAELLRAGALDVFTQAITMKKSRTGILITVICQRDRMVACQEILFREARVKIAQRSDRVYTVQPEYEDCAQLARQHQVPLWQVQACVKLEGEKKASKL